MFKKLALAGAATINLLAWSAPAQASAFANIQTIWEAYFDGIQTDGGGFSKALSGLTVTPFGNAIYNSGAAHDYLTLNRTLADGAISYDASSSGGLRIVNDSASLTGGYLATRIVVSGGDNFVIGVDHPTLESASATGSVFATYHDSVVSCDTAGNSGSCTCADGMCSEGDFAETDTSIIIPDVGQAIELNYASTIHADLIADPPPSSVPEPGIGIALLLGGLLACHTMRKRAKGSSNGQGAA